MPIYVKAHTRDGHPVRSFTRKAGAIKTRDKIYQQLERLGTGRRNPYRPGTGKSGSIKRHQSLMRRLRVVKGYTR